MPVIIIFLFVLNPTLNFVYFYTEWEFSRKINFIFFSDDIDNFFIIPKNYWDKISYLSILPTINKIQPFWPDSTALSVRGLLRSKNQKLGGL